MQRCKYKLKPESEGVPYGLSSIYYVGCMLYRSQYNEWEV